MDRGSHYTPAYGTLGFVTDIVIAGAMVHLLRKNEVEYER
jgi:hypothetical protein